MVERRIVQGEFLLMMANRACQPLSVIHRTIDLELLTISVTDDIHFGAKAWALKTTFGSR